jgi:hypothetical protein
MRRPVTGPWPGRARHRAAPKCMPHPATFPAQIGTTRCVSGQCKNIPSKPLIFRTLVGIVGQILFNPLHAYETFNSLRTCLAQLVLAFGHLAYDQSFL